MFVLREVQYIEENREVIKKYVNKVRQFHSNSTRLPMKWKKLWETKFSLTACLHVRFWGLKCHSCGWNRSRFCLMLLHF